MTVLWTWDASAPGAGGSGVSADPNSAREAARAWMRANQADAGLVEEVQMAVGSGTLLTRYERTGTACGRA